MESSAPSNLPFRMRKEVVLSILRRIRPRCGEEMRLFVMGAAAGGEMMMIAFIITLGEIM